MRSFGKLASVLLVIGSVPACTVETLVPGSRDPEPATEAGGAEPAPSASSPDAASAPSGERDASARVELTAEGDCAPELRDLVVSTNVQSYDSLAVTNANAPNEGSFQVQLVSGKRDLTLSSKERTEARDVINVTAGGVVYTNMCNTGAGGCTFDASTKTWRGDPVAGAVSVKEYDPRKGTLDVRLEGVVLVSTRGQGLCKLHGSVTATRLGR